jgi:hypothetical protein
MSRLPSRRALRFTPLIAVCSLALPSAAFGQASRTWVSGVGDDANPCSRTAPCKTFAGAISKTAANGEIDVLDPGGFGTVTITKSITIDGKGFVSSILGSGTNGVIVNNANAKVTLRNLSISGVGTGANGVRILAAKSVRILNTEIFGFANGIQYIPSAGRVRLVVEDSTVYDNSTSGFSIVPTGGATTTARATIRRTDIDDNGDGVIADGTAARVSMTLLGTSIADNGATAGTGFGVHAINNAGVRLGATEITGNLIGLQADGGATMDSFGDNVINGNSATVTVPTNIGRS